MTWTAVSYEFNPICQRCGKYKYGHQYVHVDSLCRCPPMPPLDPAPEPPKQYAEGWVCPKCGRVNAPWVSTCGCPVYTTTATTRKE